MTTASNVILLHEQGPERGDAIVRGVMVGKNLSPVLTKAIEDVLQTHSNPQVLNNHQKMSGETEVRTFLHPVVELFKAQPDIQKELIARLMENDIVETFAKAPYVDSRDLLLYLLAYEQVQAQTGPMEGGITVGKEQIDNELMQDDTFASKQGEHEAKKQKLEAKKTQLKEALEEKIKATTVDHDVYQDITKDPVVFYQKLEADIESALGKIEERESAVRGLRNSFPSKQDLIQKMDRQLTLLSAIREKLIELRANLIRERGKAQTDAKKRGFGNEVWVVSHPTPQETGFGFLSNSLHELKTVLIRAKDRAPVSIQEKSFEAIEGIVEPIMGAIEDLEEKMRGEVYRRQSAFVALQSLDRIGDQPMGHQQKSEMSNDVRHALGSDALIKELEQTLMELEEAKNSLRDVRVTAIRNRLKVHLTRLYQECPEFVANLQAVNALRCVGVQIEGGELVFWDGTIVSLTQDIAGKVQETTED